MDDPVAVDTVHLHPGTKLSQIDIVEFENPATDPDPDAGGKMLFLHIFII